MPIEINQHDPPTTNQSRSLFSRNKLVSTTDCWSRIRVSLSSYLVRRMVTAYLPISNHQPIGRYISFRINQHQPPVRKPPVRWLVAACLAMSAYVTVTFTCGSRVTSDPRLRHQ